MAAVSFWDFLVRFIAIEAFVVWVVLLVVGREEFPPVRRAADLLRRVCDRTRP